MLSFLIIDIFQSSKLTGGLVFSKTPSILHIIIKPFGISNSFIYKLNVFYLSSF